MSAAIKSVKQNISIVWGQLRVSTINLDITEEEFQELTHAIRNATERLLGPESEIRRRLDRDRHNHGGSLSVSTETMTTTISTKEPTPTP